MFRTLTTKALTAVAGFAVAFTLAPASWSPATGADQPWQLTSYYTPVESFFVNPDGTPAPVAGEDNHLVDTTDCGSGAPLGAHPAAFLARTDESSAEGSGRLTTGPAAGQIATAHGSCLQLKGGQPTGSVPSPTGDRVVRPMLSVAADPTDAAALGYRVHITGCGGDVSAEICGRITDHDWQIADTGPAIGTHHLDLYIGEQTMPVDQFENKAGPTNPKWFNTSNAQAGPGDGKPALSDHTANNGQTVAIDGVLFGANRNPVDVWLIDFTTNQTIWFSSGVTAGPDGDFEVTTPVGLLPCGHNIRAIAKDGDYNDSSAQWSNVAENVVSC